MIAKGNEKEFSPINISSRWPKNKKKFGSVRKNLRLVGPANAVVQRDSILLVRFAHRMCRLSSVLAV